MKSDTDYIRAGVEIAPGWSLEIHGSHKSDYIRSLSGFRSTVQARDEITAALAAALVEIVDAGEKTVDIQKRWCAVTDWPGGDIVNYTEGPDRTMNTIRCCVDFFEANPGLKP